MHLVSVRDQTVSLAGRTFSFAEGESLHTESSYKFDRERIEALAGAGGWRLEHFWTDPDGDFSLSILG